MNDITEAQGMECLAEMRDTDTELPTFSAILHEVIAFIAQTRCRQFGGRIDDRYDRLNHFVSLYNIKGTILNEV